MRGALAEGAAGFALEFFPELLAALALMLVAAGAPKKETVSPEARRRFLGARPAHCVFALAVAMLMVRPAQKYGASLSAGDAKEFVLGFVPELLIGLVPRLVKKVSSGAAREEKFCPDARRFFGVRPTHCGYALIAVMLVFRSLAPALEIRNRLKYTHIFGWLAMLFPYPEHVTVIYMVRAGGGVLDVLVKGDRGGAWLPALLREGAITLLLVAAAWYDNLSFKYGRLPKLAMDRPRGGRAPGTAVVRRHTVYFEVDAGERCSDIAAMLQGCRGHFPLPHSWEKELLQVEGGRRAYVFLEYVDETTAAQASREHHDPVVATVKAHPSRQGLYGGIGWQTKKEIETKHQVEMAITRAAGDEHVYEYEIKGKNAKSCREAHRVAAKVASCRQGDTRELRIRYWQDNAYARGAKAQEALLAAGIVCEGYSGGIEAVRRFLLHGGDGRE